MWHANNILDKPVNGGIGLKVSAKGNQTGPGGSGLERRRKGVGGWRLFLLQAEKDAGAKRTLPRRWYAGRDSNPQPSEPESDALSIEPPAHIDSASLL